MNWLEQWFPWGGSGGSRSQSVSLGLEELESRQLLSAATLSVASSFIQSPENLRNFVAGEYTSLLGRSADAGGLDFWVHQLETGMSFEAVEAAFASSPEYSKTTGTVTPAG